MCLVIYLWVAKCDLRNRVGERQEGFTFLKVSHGKKSQLWDQSISQACLVFFANNKAYFCPVGSNVKTGLDSAVVSIDSFEFRNSFIPLTVRQFLLL